MQRIDLGALAHRAAEDYGDAPFVEFEGKSISYVDFDDRVHRTASALQSLGVRTGDRVAVVMRNRPEFLELMFGCARAGIVVVPINRRLAAREVMLICADARAKVLVTEPDFAQLLAAAADAPGVTHRIVVGNAGDPPPGVVSYELLVESVPVNRDWQPIDPSAAQAIHYTSGTTGAAKGAVRSHESNFTMMLGSFTRMPVAREDAWLYALPIHSAGLYALSLPSLMGGGRLLLTAEFDADLTLRLVSEREVTHMFLVPTMWEMLMRSPLANSVDLSSLRHTFWGGMPMTDTLLDRLERWLPTPCLGLYGMTEATGATYSTPEVYHSGRRHSSGFPIEAMEVKILNADGEEVAPNTPGEVVLRGPLCMDGYFGKPELTRETFTEDGWLRSGDLGWLDEDGALTVADRIKDMIISGGENIYAAEVETVIQTLPGVLECAVVGLPDEFWGQSVCAFVVAEDALTVDNITTHARTKLAGYKVPRRVVLLDELPKNATGKVEKAALKTSVIGSA